MEYMLTFPCFIHFL